LFSVIHVLLTDIFHCVSQIFLQS